MLRSSGSAGEIPISGCSGVWVFGSNASRSRKLAEGPTTKRGGTIGTHPEVTPHAHSGLQIEWFRVHGIIGEHSAVAVSPPADGFRASGPSHTRAPCGSEAAGLS